MGYRHLHRMRWKGKGMVMARHVRRKSSAFRVRCLTNALCSLDAALAARVRKAHGPLEPAVEHTPLAGARPLSFRPLPCMAP
jgi:hypothetical protein